MPRTKGAIQHSPEKLNFIRNNWKKMTDQELADALLMKVTNLHKLRLSIGIRRANMAIKDPATIALICELYANGRTLKSISKVVDKAINTVSTIIDKNWSYTTRSYNTVTLVLESRVNLQDDGLVIANV